jgi:hypothetical protein
MLQAILYLDLALAVSVFATGIFMLSRYAIETLKR